MEKSFGRWLGIIMRVLDYVSNARYVREGELTKEREQVIRENSERLIELTLAFNRCSECCITAVEMYLILLGIALQEEEEAQGKVFGKYLDEYSWGELEMTILLLYTPKIYTISDIKWRKGIERKQIENILKVAVHQAFNYRLCERVTSKTIDILVGNVVELEWE